MKTYAVAAVLVLCCTLAIVSADLDDDLMGLLLGQATANGMGSCVQYGYDCGRGNARCCQYLGYSAMSCRNSMCLQTQCASFGMRCSAAMHCCYHEGLTCSGLLGTNTCGFANNGRK